MINGVQVTALIPARGGSKGVPRKNLRRLGSRSLLQIAVDCGRQSLFVDGVIVSTEDPEIAAEATRVGADEVHHRSQGLAADTSPMIDVVMEFIDVRQPTGWIVLLQPTSPLRAPADIDAALRIANEASATSVVSLCRAQSHPDWLWRLSGSGRMHPFSGPGGATRRQDLEPLYQRNGAIFAFTVEWFLRTREFSDESTVAYLMPEEQSLDVDSEFDLTVAEILLARREE